MAQADFDATALQGMPSSAVATGLVDHVLPAEAMAARLTDYHQHLIEVAKKKDGDGNRGDLQEHLAKITSILHARSAHDFSGYKQATLIRRLQRRMQVLHMDNAVDYVERLDRPVRASALPGFLRVTSYSDHDASTLTAMAIRAERQG